MTPPDQQPDSATPRSNAFSKAFWLSSADQPDHGWVLKAIDLLMGLEKELTAATTELARLKSAAGRAEELAVVVDEAAERSQAESYIEAANGYPLASEACERQAEELTEAATTLRSQHAELSRLRALVDELQADKDRLDWLQKRGVCWRGANELISDWVIGDETEWHYAWLGDVRPLIDSARSANGKEQC